MIVRPEAQGDREASIEVERVAFGRTLEAEIAEAVRDDAGSFALVAEDDGEIVGHVQMSRAWVGEQGVVALGPIGVQPERQRQGIGASLVRAAIEEARARNEPAVILLGDPAYYGRLGFVPAARFGLSDPFADPQEEGLEIGQEHFQIAVLDDARVTGLAGEVRWHPAFG